MDIGCYLAKTGALIQQRLEELVPEKKVPYSQLFQAARYALLGGGKRLRPILTLATVESLEGSIEAALTPACALEMIHTYSLIHDDLPCMDNDDFRRGKPSLHRAFPEGTAVLTGDYLLTYAFEIIAQAPYITGDQKLQLIEVLAKNSGSEGMLGGQILDLEAETKAVDIEMLQHIHHQKTGALLSASIAFGSIIANASEKEREALNHFGKNIGLAFQIIDDVLDHTESLEKHGKQVSSDLVNNKKTYVTLLGIEQSKQIAHDLFLNAIHSLKLIPKKTSLFEEIARFIIFRNK